MGNQSFINEVLAQNDHGQLELIADYEPEAILQTICSFLNGDGGWIVVGHSAEMLVGIEGNPEALTNQLRTYIADRIFPQPLIYAKTELYQNQYVILINIIKGARQPYSFDGKYYVRFQNKPQIANVDDISLLLRNPDNFASTWEKSTTIDASLAELDTSEIMFTITEANKLGRGNKLPSSVTSFLNYFQISDYQQVKNAALILFGLEPFKFLPQVRIRITVIPFEKTGSKYSDTFILEENLFSAFVKIQHYFEQNLPMVSEFKHNNWNRIDRKKFPMDALDEAIINAIVHRDYGDVAGEITINIYPDRMDIINSGEIPKDIITGNNRIEAHHSILRNPTVAHMFYLRGKMEKLGRGLDLIMNRFIESGLQKPEWKSKNGYTTLTLFAVVEQVAVNRRMFQFVKNMITHQEFSREDYEKFFKGEISEKTARTDIVRLSEGDWIEKIGKGPHTRYARTNKELPDATG